MSKIHTFDNEGGSFDRYTVAFLDEPNGKYVACVGMSVNPCHPQGFGQHSECLVGAHLGKSIRFLDLPEQCQELVRRDLAGLDIEDVVSGEKVLPRVKTLAVIEVISRKKVKAEFRAIRGDAGNHVAEYHYRQGALRISGSTGCRSKDSDNIIIGRAIRCAQVFIKTYCASGKINRKEA